MTSGVIQICVHCGTQCGGKYCPDCNTAEKRRMMDAANKKLFEENNLTPHICDYCSKIGNNN